MKKITGAWLSALFCLSVAVSVHADAGKVQSLDYQTDYYMVAASADGGVDIFSEADRDSAKLNVDEIPNGTAFHIEGEEQDKNGEVWGYTRYHGMNGYLPVGDDFELMSRAEAADHEFKAYGGKTANYDITVAAEDGEVILYNGPGIKYGEVTGAPEIKNGTVLHISSDVDTLDGAFWGRTTTEGGYTGWIDIHKAAPDQVPALGSSEDAAAAEASAEPTPTPTAAPTAAPKPTATAAPTAAPELTATAVPTSTPEPTAAAEPTATEEPEATATTEPTATEEPEAAEVAEEEAEETSAEAESAKDDMTESSWYQNSTIWILALIVLIALLIAVYLLKKNKGKENK